MITTTIIIIIINFLVFFEEKKMKYSIFSFIGMRKKGMV